MTMTTTNWFITAATLRAAFEHENDIWRLTEDGSDTEELVEFIRDLHDDELPNNWRYDTIVSIIDAIVNNERTDCDPYELADGIAYNLADIYNSDLLNWYAENTSRLCYIEEAEAEGLLNDKSTIDARLTVGQCECIKSMAIRIIEKLN